MVKNLKMLRIKSGMTQQQLASMIGISQQSINKYENHDIEPDIKTLIAISDLFGTSVDFLIGNTGYDSHSDNSKIVFSNEEKQIIQGYRKLNKAEKICIKTLIKTYNNLTE